MKFPEVKWFLPSKWNRTQIYLWFWKVPLYDRVYSVRFWVGVRLWYNYLIFTLHLSKLFNMWICSWGVWLKLITRSFSPSLECATSSSAPFPGDSNSNGNLHSFETSFCDRVEAVLAAKRKQERPVPDTEGQWDTDCFLAPPSKWANPFWCPSTPENWGTVFVTLSDAGGLQWGQGNPISALGALLTAALATLLPL